MLCENFSMATFLYIKMERWAGHASYLSGENENFSSCLYIHVLNSSRVVSLLSASQPLSVLYLQIKSLEDERDRLSQQLAGNKQSAALGKISEARRQRLKELEQQMSDLKRKLKEQSRIVKMKEQTDKQVTVSNSLCVGYAHLSVWLTNRIYLCLNDW